MEESTTTAAFAAANPWLPCYPIQEHHQEDDTLSLSDLQFDYVDDQNQEPNTLLSSQFTETQDLFEFSTHPIADDNLVIFCGKIIAEPTKNGAVSSDKDDDPRDYLFPFSSSRLLSKKSVSMSSTSLTYTSSPVSPTTASSRSSGHQYGSSSRKHKALIGLAKIPPKMELSDIKKRQKRQSPPLMFPVVAEGYEEAIVSTGTGGGRRGLVNQFSCRAHLRSALAKASFGCIQMHYRLN